MQSDRVGRVPARGILLLAKSVEYTRPDVGSFSQRFGDGPKSIEGCPGNMVLHALDVTVNCFFVDVEKSEELGQEFVPINDSAGDLFSLGSEDGATVFLVFCEALGVKALEHVGHAGLGNSQSLGDVNGAGISLFLDKMKNLLEVVVHGDTTASPGRIGSHGPNLGVNQMRRTEFNDNLQHIFRLPAFCRLRGCQT